MYLKHACTQQKRIDACHLKSIIGHSYFKKLVPYYRLVVTCINLFLLCASALMVPPVERWPTVSDEKCNRGEYIHVIANAIIIHVFLFSFFFYIHPLIYLCTTVHSSLNDYSMGEVTSASTVDSSHCPQLIGTSCYFMHYVNSQRWGSGLIY